MTADHVNPERPWPALDRLRDVTEARGFALAPRLTVYPRYVLPSRALARPRVCGSRCSTAATPKASMRRPRIGVAEKISAADTVNDGAEIVLVGHRSSAWYSRRRQPPPVLVPGHGAAHGCGPEVLDGVVAGQEPGIGELTTLLRARGREVAAVAEVADDLRRQTVGDAVAWVHNRSISYTNVCTFKCRFCGFSKGPLSLNLRGTPYLLTLDDIAVPARRPPSGAPPRCASKEVHLTSTATTTST